MRWMMQTGPVRWDGFFAHNTALKIDVEGLTRSAKMELSSDGVHRAHRPPGCTSRVSRNRYEHNSQPRVGTRTDRPRSRNGRCGLVPTFPACHSRENRQDYWRP